MCIKKFITIISLMLGSPVLGETIQSFESRNKIEQNLIFTGIADTFDLLHQMNEAGELKQQFCLPDDFNLQQIHARAAYSTVAPSIEDNPSGQFLNVSLMVLIGLQAMFPCV